MANVYITKEEQLRYENDNLKNQLWHEHKKLFEIFKASRKEFYESKPCDSEDYKFLRYTILKDIVFSLGLYDEYQTFLEFEGE